MNRIKTALANISIAVMFLVGIGLLSLTNQGILPTRRPYAGQLADSFQPGQGTLVIEHVNLIPMDREEIVENQTVVIRDGTIAEVRAGAPGKLPADTVRIDGRERYLVPGLADMHVHVKDEYELLLFVANGVTTIRNMWGGTGALRLMGFPDHLAWREQIEMGELFGPTLFTSGPIMEGPPKTMPLMEVYDNPAAAAEAVTRQFDQGYDFIKVYDYLDLPTYLAVIDTARSLHLAVSGHVPKNVGLDVALASGQLTIEHLSGIIDNDSGEYLIPEDQLAFYAGKVREAEAWICPTIAVYQMHVTNQDLHQLEERPEMAYVSPGMMLTWQYFSRPGSMSNITYQGDYPARIREMFLHTTRILHENGVRFILGTDSDNPYLVPGFSLLDELDYLVQAGLTPYEALETGTRNAAEALGRLDEAGTVEPGKQADLILLDANPLSDIGNIRKRAGIILRGQWYSEARLQGMLEDLAASFTPSLFDRTWPLSLIAAALYLFLRRRQDPPESRGMKNG